MLERLKEYLEMFEQEKREIEQADDEELVAEMVRVYEADVRAKLAEKRSENVAEKIADIKAVEKLIALESAKLEAEAKARADSEVVIDKFQIENTNEYSSTITDTAEQNIEIPTGISI